MAKWTTVSDEARVGRGMWAADISKLMSGGTFEVTFESEAEARRARGAYRQGLRYRGFLLRQRRDPKNHLVYTFWVEKKGS